METTSTKKQERIMRLAPNRYRLRYLYREVSTQGENNEPEVSHVAEEVTVSDPSNKQEVVSAIVRTRYTGEQVQELLSSFSRGENVIDYMRYQNWRNLAAKVAEGSFYIADFDTEINSQIIEVSMPFSATLAGGEFADLADYALKAKVNTYPDPMNNIVKVYLSYMLPQHLELLEASPNVSITTHAGLL